MNILIDADIIVYRAAWAAEKSDYVLWVRDYEDSEPEAVYFTYTDNETAGEQMQEWVKDYSKGYPAGEIVGKERQTRAEPVENALHSAKKIMNRIVETCGEHYGHDKINLVVLLSGTNNFRNEIATIQGYKANRKDQPKPIHYKAVRDYLMTYWGARIVDGREADDELSIMAKADPLSVIVSVDKDLHQIAGEHYDPVADVFFSIAPDEGDLLFYRQCLTGDATDNIPGIPRVGPATADRILSDAVDDMGRFDEHRAWQIVVESYKDYGDRLQRKPVWYDKYKEHGAEVVALEVARLVKLQDYAAQLWNPPGVEDELINAGVNLDD